MCREQTVIVSTRKLSELLAELAWLRRQLRGAEAQPLESGQVAGAPVRERAA